MYWKRRRKSSRILAIDPSLGTITYLIADLCQDDNSSVPEDKLMGVELIGVYKSGSINWG